MFDLTSALEYCHDRWVFHRDLKTSNLLMNNKGEVSICDFGLARYYHEPPRGYSPTVVTLWYRAPEVLLSDTGKGIKTNYGPAIDVWSLGCIFAELVLFTPLLAGQGEIDQIKKIFELLGTPDEKSWPGHGELFYFRKVRAEQAAHETPPSRATATQRPA
jgi:cell division cycle 2-like protein